MIVKVTQESVNVEEADDLLRLHVQSRVDANAAVERLTNAGLASTASPTTDDVPPVVWLSIPALRKMAHDSEGLRKDTWDQSWSNMIAFADQHGWVRDGAYVRAHIEQQDA